MKAKSWLQWSGLIFGVTLCGMTGSALAAGALAISGNPGGTYGWAVAMANSDLAATAALNRCGIGCQIVLRFEKGCGAYVIDESIRSSISGWGAADTAHAAQNRAMTECMLLGGKSCVVRVWGCN